jgi:cbb3-type cytochrome oxidase subunit 3
MKSLTDVVSGAGLSVYAEVALVIFFVAFLGIVISLFAPSRKRTYEHLRRLPIDGEKDTDPSAGTIAIPRFARNDNSLCRDDRDSSLRSE